MKLLSASRKGQIAGNDMRMKLAELDEQMNTGVRVRFGDASIASPFTCKSPSIALTAHILKQGRCTLVTTIQMFKILAVNSLMSAYSLSVLYLHGIKQGDTQATLAGLIVALFFFFISRATPLRKLSSERPPSRIFSYYVILSIFGQFLVHLSILMLAVEAAEPFKEQVPAHMVNATEAVIPDSGLNSTVETKGVEEAVNGFAPSVINTVVYLMGLVIQANSFAANYLGHPFMQSLSENKMLKWGLILVYSIIAITLLGGFPPISDLFECVDIPDEDLRYYLISLVAIDTILVQVIERTCRKYLSDSSPSTAATETISYDDIKVKES
jgi:cation-transporting ATPase 13A1